MGIMSSRTVGILVAVVSFILIASWLINPDHGLGKATGTVAETLDEYVDYGVDTQEASVVSTAANDQAAFDALTDKLKEVHGFGDSNCFAKFSGFPTFLTGGSSVSFEAREYASTGLNGISTKLRLYGGEGGQQLVESKVVDGIKPCLIHGETEVNNFQDIFFDANVVFEDKKIALPNGESYYSDVFTFLINGDGEYNKIVYDESYLFHDLLIFTADGSSMCFLPYFIDTFPLECRSAAEATLSDNCFDSSEEGSIYSKIGKNGVARYCEDRS